MKTGSETKRSNVRYALKHFQELVALKAAVAIYLSKTSKLSNYGRNKKNAPRQNAQKIGLYRTFDQIIGYYRRTPEKIGKIGNIGGV